MKVAHVYSELSYAKRKKVGCAIVIDGMVFPGYNGTPPGWDNRCETEDGSTTLPEVIHAEQNALDKLVRSTIGSTGADVFVTTAPCGPCALRLIGAQVRAVYYSEIYRSDAGLILLRRAGIPFELVEVK
jgi:dCMP deaminase